MAEITISIPWRRDLPKKALTVALGFGAGLLACELAARLLWSMPLVDRFELTGRSPWMTADCYPRAAGVSMPVDLDAPEGRERFLQAFPDIVKPLNRGNFEETSPLLPLREGLRTPEAIEVLRRSNPLCAIYDHDDRSPRHEQAPERYGETIALLGDSFVFGQGLEPSDTFVAKLSQGLGARIRSYAHMGADMPQIRIEFRHAMRDQDRFHFSKLVYVYVLNDPLRDKALQDRLDMLNDLMNMRFSVMLTERKSRLDSVLEWAARRSALARMLIYRFTRLTVAERTLQWYRDLHDPKANPGVVSTFSELGAMSREAAQRGIEFIVLVYPLMLDMARYPLAEVHREIKGYAAMNGVELHDLLPAFEKGAGDQALNVHPIDYHPNARAQQIAVDDAVEYLKARRGK